MTAVPPANRAGIVRAIAEQHTGQSGPLLPILHDVQDELGHLTRDDLVVIAGVLNVSVAEVHGVVSFYHDFRMTPPAAHSIRLCRAEACQAVGAAGLWDAARERAAGGEYGNEVEVDEVFCLGNCALGPSGMVDGRLVGRLDLERLESLTGAWR
jgi:formate dehydrogenase subunit gamma